MTKAILSIIFVTVLWMGTAATSASAAPGDPTRPTPLPCSWNGQLYPHGAYRYAPISLNGQLIRYDVYQCQNTKWVYRFSSDDIN